MRIAQLEYGENAERARISATVSWEENDQADREIWFETDAEFGDYLARSPNSFLVASVVPAMHFGERRVYVEGSVCPMLRDGLAVVQHQLHQWYGSPQGPASIEPSAGFAASLPASTPRTSSFMSGGIDSLATYYRNRLEIPSGHPLSLTDLILIYDHVLEGQKQWQQDPGDFEAVRARLSRFARATGANLIPVHTNMRLLEGDALGRYYTDLWVLKSFGACLASTAHALSAKISTALIPSSHDVNELEPLGSHPLLDPNFSSSSLDVRHDGLAHSRMDKTQLVAGWDVGLQTLRVCADPLQPAEPLNCGRCEKCLRTMASLLACGKLAQCSAFAQDDVSKQDVASLRWSFETADASPFAYLSHSSASFWSQLVEPLRRIGRDDLAVAVRDKMAEGESASNRGGWWSAMKRLDARMLGGSLSRIHRASRTGGG